MQLHVGGPVDAKLLLNEIVSPVVMYFCVFSTYSHYGGHVFLVLDYYYDPMDFCDTIHHSPNNQWN